MTMERALSTQDVAESLNVSIHTVYRLITTKKLPAFKVGSLWRVNESDLEKYRTPAPPKSNPRNLRDNVRRLARLASH